MDKITIVDVGCRLGPKSNWLSLDCDIIGFDPDWKECQRLNEKYPRFQFSPFALDSTSGHREFWLTENPECGSFYRPDQNLLSNGLAGHRIIGLETVDTISLDEWMKTYRNKAVVDVLKLDTQGSELDILFGATETLAEVSWVISEVEFNPLYEDQPLFSDVDECLRDKGFQLLGFDDLNYRRGQLMWGDAYYFKAPLEGKIIEMGRAIGCRNL